MGVIPKRRENIYDNKDVQKSARPFDCLVISYSLDLEEMKSINSLCQNFESCKL